MRQEQILFEKAIQRSALFWKFTGMQINFDENPRKLTLLGHLRKRWFYLGNFVWLTYGIFSVSVIMNVISIQTILYMIPCQTFSALGDIKSFYLLYYEHNVYDIINTLRKLQLIDHSEEKEAVENEFATKRLPFLHTANKILLSLCFFGIAAFCIGPLVIINWQYRSTNEFKFYLPFNLWYPFDEQSFKGWFLAYIHQFWSAWTAAFFVFGSDCFFYTVCAFVHNQFCSLQFDMQKIGPDSFTNKDFLKAHVGTIMYRHRELIRCIELLNLVYGKPMLFNVVISSFIICLAGFNVKAIDNLMLMAPFAAILLLQFIQIFLICYYGDLLMRASIEVSDAIFNSKWYELDASSMKYCLFIMMRAQKPCKVTAFGYSDINLKTMTRIISSSWSYFTLLNTMYSKKN